MLEDGKKTSGQAQKNSRSISLCTAPTSTSFKTLIKSTRESQNKRKRLYSLKLPLCASQDMLRYLSTSASVAVVHDANITSVYVCTCVRGCQVRLQHLRCDVSHLIMDTCFLLSPPCTANMCDACMSVRACDRQTSAEVWRLMTAPRPLMTPSILSPPTCADYPQRHLLTLYANETERE